MTIIEDIQTDIDTYIANMSTSTTVDEMMQIVAALNNSSTDRMNVINTANDLPDPSTLPKGSIFYVRSIRTLVFSLSDRWLAVDGRLFQFYPTLTMGWGNNTSGQLGNSTTTSSSSPVTVVGGITNWSQVSAGEEHTLGITTDGAMFAWGVGFIGRLGTANSTAAQSVPTLVGGGAIMNWRQVSAGRYHSLGITETGIGYAWGNNTSGRLGTGTAVSSASPVTIVGSQNWSQVSGGEWHSLGINSTGIAYGWGRNDDGRLGTSIGGLVSRSSPVTVVGGITNWSQVSAGGSHSLGIAGGIAYAWGSNIKGQLGNNSTVSASSPVTVVGGITNWSQVSAAGYNYSLGIAGGILYAWGYNLTGQLGNNSIVSASSPVTVVGGITNWSQVSTGQNHSLGITSTGLAYGWGLNTKGKIGDNSTTSRRTPVLVVGSITGWNQVSAGGSHSVGLKTEIV
jgi:alpha-tubulin suppressor-like RCC1 family protein